MKWLTDSAREMDVLSIMVARLVADKDMSELRESRGPFDDKDKRDAILKARAKFTKIFPK